MNLPNARTWFRFRCKIAKHIKVNRSTGADEKKEHLEVCEYTQELKGKLDIAKEKEHVIFWIKIRNKLDRL